MAWAALIRAGSAGVIVERMQASRWCCALQCCVLVVSGYHASGGVLNGPLGARAAVATRCGAVLVLLGFEEKRHGGLRTARWRNMGSGVFADWL